MKRNERNLPKPSGMVEAEKLDGAGNKYLYENYTNRAQYEHWVRDSLRSMMGLVSRLIPEIELPAGLKGLEDNATADGFGLKQLFFRMVRQAISHGRVPLVVNIDERRVKHARTTSTPRCTASSSRWLRRSSRACGTQPSGRATTPSRSSSR
ncbi:MULTISPECIES: hypothetical protein [Pseudomonas]|uniref:hypothetical protein n=1 Tax=Pseudomonas TaxID=286 RepID=UPI001E61C577|nr:MULTISPECIES: hypothetical protein [Pseudomonas]